MSGTGLWAAVCRSSTPARCTRKLDALGIPNTYIEVPEVGHDVRSDELWEKAVVWLLEQKRVVNPDSVSLIVHTLRHQRSFWLAVEQQQTSGGGRGVCRRSAIAKTGRIRVVTDNVRRLSIGPVPGTAKPNLELDTGVFPDLDLSRPARFLRFKQRRLGAGGRSAT